MGQNRGNVKIQRKRRRRRLRENIDEISNIPYQEEFYEMIDGNLTHYPFIYCEFHGGWLTFNLANTHSCLTKKCTQFKTFQEIASEDLVEHPVDDIIDIDIINSDLDNQEVR